MRTRTTGAVGTRILHQASVIIHQSSTQVITPRTVFDHGRRRTILQNILSPALNRASRFNRPDKAARPSSLPIHFDDDHVSRQCLQRPACPGTICLLGRFTPLLHIFETAKRYAANSRDTQCRFSRHGSDSRVPRTVEVDGDAALEEWEERLFFRPDIGRCNEGRRWKAWRRVDSAECFRGD